MSWIFTKVSSLCVTIISSVNSFFTTLLFTKMQDVVAKPDPFIEIVKLLTQNAAEIEKCNKSITTLNGEVVGIKETLTSIQTQISEQPITDFPHFLGPIQDTLIKLLKDQDSLTSEVVGRINLTNESLVRLENIDIPTNLAIILEHQSALLGQVKSTGVFLAKFLKKVNENVLVTPSKTVQILQENYETINTAAEVVSSSLV